MVGRRGGLFALSCLMWLATFEARAQAAIDVALGPDVSAELELALGAELAANGYVARFSRAASPLARLTVAVEHDGARAVYRSGRLSRTARLPEDPEAAALSAVSLLVDPPVRWVREEASDPPPSEALAAPAAQPVAGASMTVARPFVRRRLVIDLSAATAILANGGRLAVGYFVDSLLFSVSTYLLHQWVGDSVVGMGILSAEYVGRVGSTDLQVGVEVGAADLGVGTNDLIAPVFGATAACAVDLLDELALLMRLSAIGTWVDAELRPGVMVTVGLRIAP